MDGSGGPARMGRYRALHGGRCYRGERRSTLAVFSDARRAPRVAGCSPSSYSCPSGWRPSGHREATSRITWSSFRASQRWRPQGRQQLSATGLPRVLAWGLQPHFSRPAVNGDLYPGHAPGLPVLIAPAFAIGGYWGTVVWIAMLTRSDRVRLESRYIVTRDVGAAWFAWSAAGLTVPVVLHGTLIYPVPIAGVLLAGGALALVSARERWRHSQDARRITEDRSDSRAQVNGLRRLARGVPALAAHSAGDASADSRPVTAFAPRSGGSSAGGDMAGCRRFRHANRSEPGRLVRFLPHRLR